MTSAQKIIQIIESLISLDNETQALIQHIVYKAVQIIISWNKTAPNREDIDTEHLCDLLKRITTDVVFIQDRPRKDLFTGGRYDPNSYRVIVTCSQTVSKETLLDIERFSLHSHAAAKLSSILFHEFTHREQFTKRDIATNYDRMSVPLPNFGVPNSSSFNFGVPIRHIRHAKSLTRKPITQYTDFGHYLGQPEEIMAHANGLAEQFLSLRAFRRDPSYTSSDTYHKTNFQTRQESFETALATYMHYVGIGTPAYKLFLRYFSENLIRAGIKTENINRLIADTREMYNLH